MTITDERKTAESAAVTELRVQVGILGERVFGIDKNLGTRIEALSVASQAILPLAATNVPRLPS